MFFRFIRFIARIVAYVGFRPVVTGRENIPKEGGFLLCGNHIHAFDPIALAIFMKRQPRFMAKKELFEKPLLRAFFRAMGAYPIDRKAAADMQAYRTTMDLLKQGNGVLIFSQGTRMKDFDNAKSGVALFALKSGAPIVPVGIRGNYKAWSKVYINFGEPISMEQYQGQKVKTELVDEVMAALAARIKPLLK